MSAIAPAERTIRPEIQALRAFAVIAVVLNHLFPASIRGGYVGVDIFFVISGFLITAHLLRELETTSRIKLGRFWARRARRLLPASLLVLALSAIATLIWMPVNLWQMVMRQIAASALYVQNWILAIDAQDYFASGNSASPATHYWSLSAEEQFYLVWPIIIIALGALASRKFPERRRLVIGVGLALVFSASLVYSIYITATAPLAAYFVTPARVWEFAAGGLLALIPIRQAHVGAKVVVSWVGWAMMASAVVLFTETSNVPGSIALIPVVGCIAVLWAGSTKSAWGPDRIASLSPVQFVGDISYSLYLWHWPILVFAPFVLNSEIGVLHKLLLFVGMIAIAYASKRWIEDPARFARALQPSLKTLGASVIAMGVVVGLSGATLVSVADRHATVLDELESLSVQSSECFGAAAVFDGAECDSPYTLTFTDSILINSSNSPVRLSEGRACQQDRDEVALLECWFGRAPGDAETGVALVGDSHAAHWSSAIDVIAQERSWNVTMLTKSSCPVTLNSAIEADWYPAGGPSCRQWGSDVVERIASDDSIDIVFTSAISREYSSAEGVLPLGSMSRLTAMLTRGRDGPLPERLSLSLETYRRWVSETFPRASLERGQWSTRVQSTVSRRSASIPC